MINKTEKEIMSNWKGSCDKPIVSICSITYNHEKYISQAIDSFLMQETDFPFEIIIGEDCSTDNTKKIVCEYIDKYPNIIKLITSDKNLGMNKNFKRTLESCKGEYIALCEGDDYWGDKYKLKFQVEFLKKNPDYVMCHNDCKVVDANNLLIKEHRVELKDRRDFSKEELQRIVMISTNTVCFRNIIKLPEEMEMIFNADTFLWSLLGEFGKCKYLDNIKPDTYRVHEGGVWSLTKKDEKVIRQCSSFYWIANYYKRTGNESLYEYFLNASLNTLISDNLKMISKKTGFKILFPNVSKLIKKFYWR